MGIGLIALGFICLEGITIGINGISLLPDYISLGIVMIGLLTIRKKMQIKYLDAAIGLALIQFVFFVMNPYIQFYGIVEYIMIILEMILRLSFYAFLFKGLNQLIQSTQTLRFMIIFWIIYLTISLYLLLSMDITTTIQVPISTIFGTALLIMKTILCYMIAYHLYKHNQRLTDDYENLDVVQIKSYSYKVLSLLCAISIGLLVILEKPMMSLLEDASYQRYMWYGEKEDKVIVDAMYLSQQYYLNAMNEEYHIPNVWLNEKDFELTHYFSLYLNVGEEKRKLLPDKSPLLKNNDYDLNVYIGQREGYRLLQTNEQMNVDNQQLLEQKDRIAITIILYDENQQSFCQYSIPLNNVSSKLQEFHYQDDSIEVNYLGIYGDYIMQLPEIIWTDYMSEQYTFFLSTSSQFQENNAINIYRENEFERKGHEMIIKNKFSYIYLPKEKDYYLHIVYDDGKNVQIIKTVRLEQ